MPSTGTLITFIMLPLLLSLYLQTYFDALAPLQQRIKRTLFNSCPSTTHAGYFEYECAGKPHQSSWDSWWHPQRTDGSVTKSELGAGSITKDWNILYHLGGNGPWVEKIIDVVDGGIALPDNCRVEQIHMLARHGERYPTRKAAKHQKYVYERMKASNKTFDGSLAFFNDWELYWSDDTVLEQLTRTGPFSGTLGTFSTGVRLRTRYQHLLDQALSRIPFQPVKFWASNSSRVIETARHYASGFFGLDFEATGTAVLEIISEHHTRGANTLTPGRTCIANRKDPDEGQRKGYRLLGEFRKTYTPSIAERLFLQTGMNFTDQDIYSMQEMCGFEITIRGRSDWCDVFRRDEFLSFEYARDLLHYYRAGPGQKYATSMGWLWLDATTNLLLEGPTAGPLFFSFVHDGDIAPLMAALDVITDKKHLPITHVDHKRKWRKSQVTPMGGRVILELLSCQVQGRSSFQPFVRLNINDGITALPDCQSGPGKSCPLHQFAARTKRIGNEVQDFRELCGLDENAAERITFLNQHPPTFI